MQTRHHASMKPLKKRLIRLLLLTLGFVTLAVIAMAVQYRVNVTPRPAHGVLEQITHVSRHGDVTLSFHAGAGAGPKDQTPVLILMPSLGRPASDFNELAAALNHAGYATYALEPRGMMDDGGLVTDDITLFDLADDVAALIDHLQETDRLAGKDVVLLGHAFGNRVARAAATKYPDKVEKVILLAAGGKAPLRPAAEKALIQSFWIFLPDSWRRPRVKYAFFADDNTVPAYWMTGWSIPASLTQASATASTPFDQWRAAGGKPLFIIQGAADRLAPPATSGDVLKRHLPEQVTLVTLENAGHALLPEQPALIEAAVLSVLGQ